VNARVALDASAIVAGLVRSHPEHSEANDLIGWLASGAATVAVPCTVPLAVASELRRHGADEQWAWARARDIAALTVPLDLNGEDLARALGEFESVPGAIALTAAAVRRHGIAALATEEPRIPDYEACGIGEVLRIADAGERLDLLIPS